MAGLIEAIDIKRKMYFEIEGAPYHCLDVEVSKPTARGGQTLVRIKMRNLLTRAVFDKTFKAGEKFAEPDLDTIDASFMYADSDGFHFMDQESFEPEFPADAEQQLRSVASGPPAAMANAVRDLRDLLWSSIDNSTSRDLDQIEVVEQLPGGDVKVLIGIADVDAFVPAHTPIDRHAETETVTVYTGVRNFPMLPESLPTGTTSLLEGDDKLAVVIEFVVAGDGAVHSAQIYRALVRNKAQLAYDDVGPWLERKAPAPPKVS